MYLKGRTSEIPSCSDSNKWNCCGYDLYCYFHTGMVEKLPYFLSVIARPCPKLEVDINSTEKLTSFHKKNLCVTWHTTDRYSHVNKVCHFDYVSNDHFLLLCVHTFTPVVLGKLHDSKMPTFWY